LPDLDPLVADPGSFARELLMLAPPIARQLRAYARLKTAISNFRDVASHAPALPIHLKQAWARVEIALREE
jgi:hypothetical protein